MLPEGAADLQHRFIARQALSVSTTSQCNVCTARYRLLDRQVDRMVAQYQAAVRARRKAVVKHRRASRRKSGATCVVQRLAVAIGAPYLPWNFGAIIR